MFAGAPKGQAGGEWISHMTDKPHLISFPSHGASDIGFVTVAEREKSIPFPIARVYWTYYTPNNVTRGRHAHYSLYQVLIAVDGIIEITTESRTGEKETFVLDSPDKGLFLPPPFWHTMRFSHTSVLLSLCSMPYEASDYIRDYELFKRGG